MVGAMGKGTVTLQVAIEAAEGREAFVARSCHPPHKIVVYDDPAFAEEKGRELGDARVAHALMRQPNVAAVVSVIVADDPSIPFDPLPLVDYLEARAALT